MAGCRNCQDPLFGVSCPHQHPLKMSNANPSSPVKREDKPHVTIYTDGACHGNPGPGGWAALLQYRGHEKLLTGAARWTTNNRMELRAALEALRALKRPCRVDLYTDSQYLRRGVTEWLPRWVRQGWRTQAKKPVKNRDLWQALWEEIQRHEITWHWVEGHAGHPENERVDRAARQALRERAAHSPPDVDASPA